MKKDKKIIAFFVAVIFSIVFSLLFKWGQKGNPFKAETLMYGIIVFLNILITGGVAFRIFHKNEKQSILQVKKNILPSFFLFVLFALVVSLSLVSIGVYVFYLLKGKKHRRQYLRAKAKQLMQIKQIEKMMAKYSF